MSSTRPQPPVGFLDAASGEPLHPVARDAWLTAVDQGWADPLRLHHEGRRASLFLAAAREEVASAVGAHPEEVQFTASCSAALAAVVERYAGPVAGQTAGGFAVSSAVEHSAVPAALARRSVPVRVVGVDRTGRVDESDFARAAASGSAMAFLQSANHEVGTRQPVTAVAERLGAVPLVVDAAATLGRETPPAGWTALVGSARKWGGPPGVGLLVDRRHRMRDPIGPFDVPGAVAAAAGLTAVLAAASEESARQRDLIGMLRDRLAATVPDLELAGDAEDRLPHILNFSCLYVDGEALVTALDRVGFGVSSGSACAATSGEPSHVLAAMGVLTHGNVRVSLPNAVRAEDVERFADELPGIVAGLRAEVAGGGGA